MSECCAKILNQSSFVNGYLHRTIGEASAKCNPNNNSSFEWTYHNFSDRTYYLGRSVRFIVSIPGSAFDVALQILQCMVFTIESIIIKLETKARKVPPNKTCTMVIHQKGLARLIYAIRRYTVIAETFYLRQDLGFIKPGTIFYEMDGRLEIDLNMGESIVHVYDRFLRKTLFGMT